MSVWDRIGLVLAKIAKGANAGAMWASQHPEVVAVVASVAHVNPVVTQQVIAGIQTARAVEAAVKQP